MYYFKHSTLENVYYESTELLVGDMFIPITEDEYLEATEEEEVDNGNN